ncbi:MAG: SDR family oxidoreductase [Candidatus Latescibacteria bacterium]|nr:SDR family oxidoreductase [Candidatus Latescibacterota bacterium]
MFAGFVEHFGGIDILVNNPFYARHQSFLGIDEEEFDRTLGVCLKGYFLCSQEAARRMVDQQRGGSIVSISSVHAQVVWATDTCYGVAKAAILRLNQSMAVELGKHQIRCNVILPGFMDTDHVFGELSPPFDPTLGPRPGSSQSHAALLHTRGDRAGGSFPQLCSGRQYHRSGLAGGWGVAGGLSGKPLAPFPPSPKVSHAPSPATAARH